MSAAETRMKVLRALAQLADDHGAGHRTDVVRLTGLSPRSVSTSFQWLLTKRLIKPATARYSPSGHRRLVVHSLPTTLAPTLAGRTLLDQEDQVRAKLDEMNGLNQ